MKRVLIGGIGNVLLGDDAVGPSLVRLLESRYTFGEDVEVADLGTPALDLTHRIAGLHAVILVDCVASDEPAGTVLAFQKEDIVSEIPAQRLDPHSPALSECLLAADMLGASPENVLLVGIVGASFEPGAALTLAVVESIQPAMDAILNELERLGIPFEKKSSPDEPAIWWGADLNRMLSSQVM